MWKKYDRIILVLDPGPGSQLCQKSAKIFMVIKSAEYLSQGVHSWVARRKPYYMCKQAREKQLAFAQEYIVKPREYWDDFVFADESKFIVCGLEGRQMVWHKRNKELRPQKSKRHTIKFKEKVSQK